MKGSAFIRRAAQHAPKSVRAAPWLSQLGKTCVLVVLLSACGSTQVGVDAQEANEEAFEALQLSPSTLASAMKHASLASATQKKSTSAGVCSLLQSSSKLEQVLGEALERRRSGAFAEAEASGSTLSALISDIERADTALVGIGLHMGAESIRHFVRYGELAELVPAGSHEQALLTALQGFSTPEGWPVYLDQLTDVSGCGQPDGLLEPLEAVVAAWPAAPECLRWLLAPVVREAVSRATTQSCYCSTVSESLEANAKLRREFAKLSVLAEVEPIPLSQGTSNTVRFNCRMEESAD